ncbi:hypothetical protein PIB30_112134 [Stylosanthes scabra]|uniref:Uncharacterized protein n=1 Tax=Stylosanthes scabra TaxID=79078 RepID=A0ABU6X336_9FABA|nr:hypothetical protein [Stylosanthes scabra]
MKKQNWEAKQGKDATHMRGRARICMLHQDKSMPKQLCHAFKPILCTHRRRKPRICVVDQQARMPSHVCTTSNVTLTSSSLNHPRIGVEDPRICVEGILAASNHA